MLLQLLLNFYMEDIISYLSKSSNQRSLYKRDANNDRLFLHRQRFIHQELILRKVRKLAREKGASNSKIKYSIFVIFLYRSIELIELYKTIHVKKIETFFGKD